MFGFLKLQSTLGQDVLQSPHTASRWLRSLPVRDDAIRQRNVVAALHDVARLPGNLDRDCIAAIEFVDAAVEEDRRRQVAQYVANVERSAAIALCIWQAMRDTNEAFVAAYRTALQTALTRHRSSSYQCLIPELVVRLLHCYGVDAKLRGFRYQRLIPAKWKEIHELYRVAVKHGVDRVALKAKRAGAQCNDDAIEQEYLRVLLVDRVNTGNLSPSELDLMSECLRDWSGDLVLDLEPQAAGGFMVDLDSKTGLVRRTGSETGAMLRFIDTSDLVARLRRESTALQEAAAGAHAPAQDRQHSLHAVVAKTWPALAATTVLELRGSVREASAAYAAVCSGITQAHEALVCKISAVDDLTEDGGRMEVKTNWTILEESATSLRLQASGGAGQRIAVGTLLAISRLPSGGSMVGVVRRVRHVFHDLVEVGVSILTRRVVAATLHIEQRAREDMHVLVDGVDVSAIGAVFRGLYIPPAQRSDRMPLGTLIVPTAHHDIGRRAVMAAGDEVQRLILREPIEQHTDWTWTKVIAAPSSVRAAA